MHQHLIVMAKAPVAGAVKSRLAAQVGPSEATRFYRVSLARLLRRLGRDPRWRTLLAVAPVTALDSGIWPDGVDRITQGSGDLGSRMQRILDNLPPGPVVIVGSDIPDLFPAHVDAAFDVLGRADVVFGPARDGGYWLVGARRRPIVPNLFAGVRWSTADTLSDTMRNCCRLSVGFLDVLADVDTAAEWRQWRRQQG
jgi:uncharacterized protein